MPAYMQRYIKNEYAKMGNYGVGSMYATGDPKYKMWKFPFGNRFANFLGYGRRAQKAPAETPWKLEIDNRWWKGWGPNKRYTLVDIPKPPKEQQVQVSQANNIVSLRNMAQRFNMALNKAADPAVNLQSPKARQQYKQIVANRLLQQFDYRNKNRGRSLEQYINYLNADPKIQKIAAVKGMDLKDIYNVLKAKHPNMSDSDLAKLISLYFIRYGKSGMKIPKYQLTPGPLPSFKDVLNKSTLDFQTNLNNLSGSVPVVELDLNKAANNARDITLFRNQYGLPGSTSINPDLIQQKAELNLKINNPEAYEKLYGVRDDLKETFEQFQTRIKVADDLGLQGADRIEFLAQPHESSVEQDDDDDAGKGAFMKKVNLSNILNPENLLKASQYISNASMARKIHDRTDDMLNEAAKYRTPNINERYTQFFDDGATSAWERSKAAARSNLNNMQTSDSRLNMAAALDLEGKLMQGDENLRQHNTSRYADWLKTNNKEHKIYDQFRYNVAKENTMRDADLMRMKAQNDVNLMSSLQEMRNNAFADVITTVQNDKAVKDDMRQSRLQNEISRQAEAKMRELIPQYFSDPNYELTDKDQMIMQQISNEMKALLDAYNYNNRASFDKVKIPTTQTG